MPTSRFSTMSTRPMPCLAPSSLRLLHDAHQPLRDAVEPLGDALAEVDLDVLGFLRGLFGRSGPLEHVCRRLVPRILQRAALVAQVPEVAVLAVDALHGGLDGHIVLGGVVQRVLAPADVPLAPGGDDAQPGIERHDRQLEAHLVVALAGGAVGDCVRAFHLGDLHHASWR